MSITNSIQLVPKVIDAGAVVAQRSVTVTDATAAVGGITQRTFPSTAEQTISLPITQTRQVFIRNTHASAKITVKWTPNGGAEATITVLGPLGAVALYDPNTHSSNGISGLKLTSDVSGSTYELGLGG